MTLPYITMGKIVSLSIGFVVAFLFALDPTWKMFIVGMFIASIPPTITGLFALRLQAKNSAALGRVENKVDGAATVLRENFDKKTEQLSDTKVQLAHAEGHREGSEGEREIKK